MELIYALQNKIDYGAVKSKDGKFLKGTPEGATAAAASAAKAMTTDFRVSITNAPGADAYPISSFTYMLIPVRFADPAKGKAMKDFLGWMLAHGESEASGMGYAALPKPVARPCFWAWHNNFHASQLQSFPAQHLGPSRTQAGPI